MGTVDATASGLCPRIASKVKKKTVDAGIVRTHGSCRIVGNHRDHAELVNLAITCTVKLTNSAKKKKHHKPSQILT